MASSILLLFVSLAAWMGAGAAYKYVVSINDDLGPCDNGIPYLDKYADMSNVMLTKSDEDALLVDGNMTTLVDFPPDHRLVIQSSYYRKERGVWNLLPMKQVFPDFCRVLFSPLELWHPVANQLQGDARKCPPPKGVKQKWNDNGLNATCLCIASYLILQTVYTVNKAELVGRYEFAKAADGEYKAQIDATYGDMQICVQITADVREDVWNARVDAVK